MATNQLKIAMQNIIENKMVEYISTIKAEYGSGVDENKLRELWQDSREQMASKFTPIFKEAICITIGENSENHVGMEMYGRGLSEKGFSMQDLRRIQEKMEKLGGESELIMLSDLKGIDGGKLKAVEESGVLLLKKGVDVLLKNPNGSKKVYEELLALDWDKKYWDRRRKRVLNKNARWNLVFREESEKSDYENGKGSVIGYTQAKLLKEWKERVEEIIGEKDLECEGNRYYDLRKCGIGFHGDGERKKVIGGNFGGTRKIVWIWYQKSQRISERQEIILENGDMYIMSEKSSGFDWKKRSLKTLRHAAGCLENSKFLK